MQDGLHLQSEDASPEENVVTFLNAGHHLGHPLLDVEHDKGGRDEAEGKDDADGVGEADPNLTAEMRISNHSNFCC